MHRVYALMHYSLARSVCSITTKSRGARYCLLAQFRLHVEGMPTRMTANSNKQQATSIEFCRG